MDATHLLDAGLALSAGNEVGPTTDITCEAATLQVIKTTLRTAKLAREFPHLPQLILTTPFADLEISSRTTHRASGDNHLGSADPGTIAG